VCLVDKELRIVFWSAGAEAITGYLSQEILGRQFTNRFLGYEDGKGVASGGVESPMLAALRDGKSGESHLSIRHKSGLPVALRLRASPLRDEQGAVIGAAEFFEPTGHGPGPEHRENKLAVLGCLDPQTEAVTKSYAQTQLQEHLETFA